MQLNLNNLRLHLNIGVDNWEKHVKRLIIFDLSLSSDSFVDYEKLVEQIKLCVHKERFDYIEDVVSAVKSHLLQVFEILDLRITAKKPNLQDSLHYASFTDYYCA